mmetsp:Transcript_30218/g.88366  ORF Transcript_30218/g.88366 Transcript_30218/m.88366 type:complete len:84 (+) Transcript_30218:988-1239(+)
MFGLSHVPLSSSFKPKLDGQVVLSLVSDESIDIDDTSTLNMGSVVRSVALLWVRPCSKIGAKILGNEEEFFPSRFVLFFEPER